MFAKEEKKTFFFAVSWHLKLIIDGVVGKIVKLYVNKSKKKNVLLIMPIKLGNRTNTSMYQVKQSI